MEARMGTKDLRMKVGILLGPVDFVVSSSSSNFCIEGVLEGRGSVACLVFGYILVCILMGTKLSNCNG